MRKVDNDLAVPLLELLRNILVSWKWDSEEDHLSLISALNGLRKDAATEFFLQIPLPPVMTATLPSSLPIEPPPFW